MGKKFGIPLILMLFLCLINNIFNTLNSAYSATVTYNRGVNIAGAEFAAHIIPGTEGTNYTFNNQETYQYFSNKGFNIFRVPILWERMQPTLRGALNTAYLNGLKNNITWAKTYNKKIIIDVHNYGRYNNNIIDGGSVSRADFADLWVKLSNEFKNEAGVYAYDLMNEPHDMGTSNWKSISQTAVTAIRNNGDNKLIMIEGNAWSGADDWGVKNGSTSWINDPADNFMYSAHCYFDSDGSGTYTRTYDQELALNPNLAYIGRDRAMDFVNWCQTNNVRGYLGEYGVPKNDSRWFTVLNNFLTTLDQAGMDATYWAGGTWWGEEPLNVQPTNNYTVDAPQMSTLLAHLPNTGDIPTPTPSPTQTLPPAAYIPKTQMTATASSYQSNTPPSYAIDGNTNTFWESQWSPALPLPQYITLNLGGTYNVSQLKYLPRQDQAHPPNGGITVYNIYVSTDGTNFTKIVNAGTWVGDNTVKFASFTPTNARYIRLEATAGNVNLACAGEIDIGYPVAYIPKNQMTATASSYQGGDPASKAIDGDNNSFWHSQWNPALPLPQSITLNLGGIYNVCQLKYLPRQDQGNAPNGAITTYNIYVSSDGTNFTKIVNAGTWASDNTEKDVSFAPVSTRYIRLEATIGNQNLAVAAEINVGYRSSVTFIPLTQMSATASSYQGSDPPNYAIDAKNNTFWHSQWNPVLPLPQYITLNLGGQYNVKQLNCLPRQDQADPPNGAITTYNIYVSTNGINFTKIVNAGTWLANKTEKITTFTATSARYIRLEATAGQLNLACVAEIKVGY